jgi:uncharacterized protein
MEQFEKILAHVMQMLETRVASFYTYHNAAHTRYVLDKSIFIAAKEKIGKNDLYLLKVAALYHDAGFTIDRIEHEALGCNIVRTQLPEFGFSSADIDKICGMIMATRVPQQPKTLLEQILADADLEYLSTPSFFATGELLFNELSYFNPELSRQNWNHLQSNFLTNHRYHTPFCRRYREFRKNRNLQVLLSRSTKPPS